MEWIIVTWRLEEHISNGQNNIEKHSNNMLVIGELRIIGLKLIRYCNIDNIFIGYNNNNNTTILRR